jgi:hypothetical protein
MQLKPLFEWFNQHSKNIGLHKNSKPGRFDHTLKCAELRWLAERVGSPFLPCVSAWNKVSDSHPARLRFIQQVTL